MKDQHLAFTLTSRHSCQSFKRFTIAPEHSRSRSLLVKDFSTVKSAIVWVVAIAPEHSRSRTLLVKDFSTVKSAIVWVVAIAPLMVQLQPKLLTDIWKNAAWEQFLDIVEDPDYAKAKGYYFDGQMRIETVGVGPDHAGDNGIIHVAVTLFCALKGIALKGLINCSYRKTEVREAQPDSSYYVADRISLAPQGSSIVNLDQTPPPDLAIEIADSSLSDDLGKKRLLYEDLGIAEYWVVDVEKTQIVAFQIVESGSHRITQSQVLPGLKISVLSEALSMSRQMDDSQIVAWLMKNFQM
jgi:Uma2 family endonuclease